MTLMIVGFGLLLVGLALRAERIARAEHVVRLRLLRMERGA